MTAIIVTSGRIDVSNGTSVEAYEIVLDTGNERVVCMSICDITGSQVEVQALIELPPAQAREMAFVLIDAADKADGTEDLRLITPEPVPS